MLSKFLHNIHNIKDDRVYYKVHIDNDRMHEYYIMNVSEPDDDLIYKEYINNNNFGIKFITFDSSGYLNYEVYDEKMWFLTKVKYGC